MFLSGDTLIDLPLDQIIDNHNLHDIAVSVVYKELDLSTKQKSDTYDIVGLSDWKAAERNQFSDENGGQTYNVQRLVYKTNSYEA